MISKKEQKKYKLSSVPYAIICVMRDHGGCAHEKPQLVTLSLHLWRDELNLWPFDKLTN
jgi:hypothetical protein